ncbi:MAG: Ig-like domain-containing protein [Bacteroidota bacterium]
MISKYNNTAFLELTYANNRIYIGGGEEIYPYNQIFTADVTASSTGAKTISVNANIATDDDGNNNSAASYSYAYNPNFIKLTSTNPTNGIEVTSLNQNLFAYFSQGIAKGTGNITIFEDDGTVVETIDVTSAQVIINGTELQVNPTNNLSPGKSFYVLIDDGAIALQSNGSIVFPGLGNASNWFFNTQADTSPPVIISYSPAADILNVLPNTPIVITYSEPIQAGSGNIQSLDGGAGDFVYDVNSSSQIEIIGNQLIVTPDTDISASMTLFYAEGVILDMSGNSAPATNRTTDPAVTINYNNNLTPTDILLSASEIEENQPSGTVVGLLSSEDPNFGDDFTYSLVAFGTVGSDNTNFTIDGNQLKTAAPFDFEQGQTEFEIGIRTTDGGGLFTQNSFSVFVTNDPSDDGADISGPEIISIDPPGTASRVLQDYPITISFDEDIQAGSTGTIFSFSGTAPNFTYEPTDPEIEIQGNKLIINVDPTDIGIGAKFVRFQAGFVEDLLGNPVDALTDFSIAVNYDNNFTPQNVSLDNTSIQENLPAGTVIGNISATDQNFGDELTYSFNPASNAGAVAAADNDNFIISNGKLLSKFVFDEDEQATHRVSLLVTDSDGATNNANFTITVTQDPNEDNTVPTRISTIPADNAQDVDPATQISITLSEDVQLTGNGRAELRTVNPNELVELFEAGDPSISVAGSTVTFTPSTPMDEETSYFFFISNDYIEDLAGNDFAGVLFTNQWNFTTSFTNVAPTDITLSSNSIQENNAVDAVIGTFSTADANGSDSFVYTLVSGNGDDDNESFDISGASLLADEVFDFETEDTYQIRVRSTDLAGTFTEKEFTINITNDSADDPIPMQQSLSPVRNGIDVPITTREFTITFDIPVQLTSNLNLVAGFSRLDIPSPATFYNPDDPAISVSGNSVTITRTADLQPNARYGLFFQSGFIESTAGVPYTGNQFYVNWGFNTEVTLNTWNGATWSNGTPTASDNVKFDADYDFETNGDLEVNDVTTITNLTLTINPNHHLIINGDLTIGNLGSVVVESGASLITFDGNTTTGNITVKRTPTFGTIDKSIGKYSIVSMPVTGTANVTQDLGNLVYEFTEAEENEPSGGFSLITSGTAMETGKGYFAAFSPAEWSFVGQPTVGTVLEPIPSPQNSGYHLVGNPYSAAIDVDEFFSDNPFASSIAIWDDGGANGGAKQSGAYIQINDVGSVTAASNLNGNTFNGHIGTAQGFFVETISQGNIAFTEDQRVTGSNGNDNFFRTSPLTSIKLSLGTAESWQETLIAWEENASELFDVQKDAKLFEYESPYKLYSIMEDQYMAIQTVGINHSEPILLGYDVEDTGTYQLTLRESNFDGDLILSDQLTNKQYYLQPGDVIEFYSNSGTFNDRFLLENSSVINSVNEEAFGSIAVYGTKEAIQVLADFQGLQPVKIYDVSGRLILEQKVTFSNQKASLAVTLLANQVYILSVGNERTKFTLK